jgi:hypothetical protein
LGICFIVLYVDNNLIIGHPEAVDHTIDQLRKNNLMLKIENNLHDYLSCEIVLSDDRTKTWLGQPHLISNLEKKYGETVQKLYNYLTPGTPRLHQVRGKDTALILSKEKQERYRSGIGMLLYLVKHSQPDIANAV